MLLCAVLSLRKTLQLVCHNKLFFLIPSDIFIPTLSHAIKTGKQAALTDSCLSCWSKNNNTKRLSVNLNMTVGVCVCVFPGLSERLLSLIHLCNSLQWIFSEGENMTIFTKEQIPNVHLNSPRAQRVLSFESGLSDPRGLAGSTFL